VIFRGRERGCNNKSIIDEPLKRYEEDEYMIVTHGGEAA